MTYRGLQFGFVDNGVDLILERDYETIYVQCKYTLGKSISANEVRWNLHKADVYLAIAVPRSPTAFPSSGARFREMLFIG